MKKLVSKLIGFYLNLLAIVASKKAGKLGFELFCHPFRGKITPKHLAFFQTANRFELVLGKEKIQGYQWGTGSKKILLLHGWQSHTYRWKSYIEAFDKERYSIFSLDAPGHGQSSGKFMSVPFYKEAIEALILRVGKPDLVLGHSIGGFTGMYTFYLHTNWSPEKFVALAPPGEAQEFFDFYTIQLGLTKRCTDLTIEHFTQAVGNPPSYFSAPNFAKDFNFSGLLIHDEDDDETSVGNSKAIHQQWKDSKLIITKGKGHNLKSAEVVKLVMDFMESTESLEYIKTIPLQKQME